MCQGEIPTQASPLPSPLILSYPVKIPNPGDAPVPDWGFRGFQQGRSRCSVSGVTSSEGKPAAQTASTAGIAELCPSALPSPCTHTPGAEQGISDPPHLSPAG